MTASLAMNVRGRHILKPAMDSFARGKPMRELIEQIAKAIVEKPEEVQVRGIEGENAIVIELRVAKEDVGKVIGREGRTAQSMRTILTAASTKLGRRSHLDIVD